MKVLITGAGGQDSSYLAELLLKEGVDVYGVIRRSSWPNTGRIDHLFPPEQTGKIFYGDIAGGITSIIDSVRPSIIFNLAAQSHVGISFMVPGHTCDVNSMGALHILDGIKLVDKGIKYYQASSSEMFGISPPPQHELTPMLPVSPYGCAKLMAYHLTRTYRMAYGMFASNGILFNHESERRGHNFVTRKITMAACKIKLGLQKELRLGNLHAMRDWGHSRDYMEAIWKIMNHDKPDDFVVATGQHHSVEEFVIEVFSYLDMDWKDYVVIDQSFFRPVEVPDLLGDATKIRETLGWEPKVKFKELVKLMVESDMELAKREQDNR